MPLFGDIPFGLAAESGCPVCYSKLRPQTQLLLCGGCKVVRYCGAEHQKRHRPEHKAACTSIIKSRAKLEKEEATLRAHPGDIFLPSNIFENGVGRFWGLLETRDYMRARFAAADALLQIDTIKAVENALAHFQDMLRLCRSDNLGVRDIVPDLLLRLGREQECYDFLKWWAVIDDKHHYNGRYDWGDVSLPYLDISGADAFEAVDAFASGLSLCQLVILALLKVRLQLDIECHDPQYMDFGSPWPPTPTEFRRPIGEIAQKKVRTIRSSNVPEISEVLKNQYQALIRMVHNKNPHFWEALVDASEDTPSLPSVYSPGSVEEAILAVYQCKKAWEESVDAIIMIESEIGNFTEVYEGPAATSDGMNTGEVAGTPGEPRVLCLCLEYESMFNDIYGSLISKITAKAKIDRATTQKAALDMLTQNPPPSVILVTDAGAVHLMKVWERVIDCLRGGSTVVLAASFSSFVNEGQFNRCFGKIGLPWKRGGYYRTNVYLRPRAVDDRLKDQLLPTYSQKALYVQGVAESDVWYAGGQDEVAVAFTKVGNGMLGYVGDVNGEDGSEAVVLAMLRLLN
ncbi:hypothetical protein F4804DRAFT_325969 [Jackrogersella minutella]|nr:hypothetical protein F4804DRAFT_325969 [Jackrogersella minutella]